MKQTILMISLLAVFSFGQAQESILEDYDWVNAPTIEELTEEEAKESQVYILDNMAYEYAFEGESGFLLMQYKMVHRIVHLNDDDAVDNFNKISFPPATYVDFISRKARVIKKSGKVINLDDNDILTHEGNDGQYDYFALEGIEVGDEVEYLFVYKKWPPSISGLQLVLQADHAPKRKCTYTIISPKHLEFKIKSYNGFPELSLDSTYDEVNYYTATWENMPKFKSEKYAAEEANMAYVIHRFNLNTEYGSEQDPYPDLSKRMASNFGDIELGKSKISKLVKKAALEEHSSDEDKIRAAEKYIKENFSSSSYESEVKKVVKKESGSQSGILNTYATLFRYLNIKYELVYTCDRSDFKFDPDFDCHIFLQNTMFYFPKLNMYLSPFNYVSRLGLPPASNTANLGLFIKFIELNGTYSGYSNVKMIEPLDADMSVDRLDIVASFEELPTTKVEFKRELSGYNANGSQIIFDYLTEDVRKDIEEGFVNYVDEDMDISEITVSNMGADNVPLKPIEVEAEFTSDKFVSKAGNNYLINVGLLIGPQGQLYDEEERTMDVENEYNRVYQRKIVLNIPEGYEVTNLEALEANIMYSADSGNDSMAADEKSSDIGFISSYRQEGNKVIIEINEYYRSIFYTLDRYKQFEAVINAAADFNKVTLVLKKV